MDHGADLFDDQKDHAAQVGIFALVELGHAEEDVCGLFLPDQSMASGQQHSSDSMEYSIATTLGVQTTATASRQFYLGEGVPLT